MTSSEAWVEDLFKRGYAPLVRALTPAVGVDAAREIAQEAFLEAFLRARRVRHLDNPLAWIRRVAVNRALNYQRSAVRRRRSVHLLPTPEAADSPVADIDLQRAIEALTPRQQMIVGLYYGADLSVEETASLLSVSTGTIKSTLSDCRTRLRNLLEVHDGGT